MPNYIVKIDPNQDAYVYWSKEADAPHFGGTRAELEDHLRKCGEDAELPARFERADATGSSAKEYVLNGLSYPGFYSWAEPGDFVAEQRGLVKRADLMEMWRCVGVGRPYPHILHAFPDGHIVGWHEPQTTQ
jgi:hypothetical protein